MGNYIKKTNIFLRENVWIIFLVIPLFFLNGEIDNDFWFIINHGKYIVKNGFDSIEPFTVHSDFAFSFEKWLSCTTFFGIYSFFGPSGLYWFKICLAFLIYLVMFFDIYYITKRKDLACLLTIFVGTFMSIFYIKTRPQLFSFLILLCEFCLLESWKQEKENTYLWFLPILSCLYMQYHSTMWPIFFIIIMPYLFDFNFIAKKLNLQTVDDNKNTLLIFAALSFAAGFINPYGYKSVFYLFNSFGVFNLDIKELATPSLKDFVVIGFPSISCFIIVIIRLIIKKTKLSDLPLRALFFFGGTLVMSILAVRNIVYFILFGTISCSYAFVGKPKIYKKKNQIGIAFLAAVFFLLSTMVIPENNENYYSKTISYDVLNKFNEKIIASGQKPKNIKLFTAFNNGSYAEWLGYKCYIDPRAEVFAKKINKKEDIIEEYLKLDKGEISYLDIQKKYNFDYWLINNSGTIYEELKKDMHFKEYVVTEDYSVFVYV